MATGWPVMPTGLASDTALRPPTPSRKERGEANLSLSPLQIPPRLSFLMRKLETSHAEHLTKRELRIHLMGILPRNALVILFEKMENRLDLKPEETFLFAREMKSPEPEARRCLAKWIRFTRPWQFPEDPSQWVLDETLSPHTAALLLEEGPRLVRDTFYNIIEGSSHDAPRVSMEKTEARRQWEKFWETFAQERGWKIKPNGFGMYPDINRGLAYAKEAHWPLSRLYLWLQNHLRHDKKREFILRAFEHAMDVRVLKGKREVAGRRNEIAHALRKYNLGAGESTFRKWVFFWSRLAREMEEANALRKEKPLIRRITGGQRACADYRPLFAAAARFREDRRGPALHRMFQERGMRKEILTAANILANVNEKPRVPASRLRVAGTGVNTMARVEKRIEDLAQDFRIPLKTKSPISRRQQTAKEIGKRLQTLREIAQRAHLGPASFLQLFRTDPFLKILLGERRALIPLILELWIEEQSAETSADLAALWKEHPFQEGGISIQQFRFWWRRFDRLKEEFGWEFSAASPLRALPPAG